MYSTLRVPNSVAKPDAQMSPSEANFSESRDHSTTVVATSIRVRVGNIPCTLAQEH